MARGERRLLISVLAGHTYVCIAPDATPALEVEETGAEITPDVPRLALADSLLFLVEGRGLCPHAASPAPKAMPSLPCRRHAPHSRRDQQPVPGNGAAVRERRGRLLPRADAVPARVVGAPGCALACSAPSPTAREGPGTPNENRDVSSHFPARVSLILGAPRGRGALTSPRAALARTCSALAGPRAP